MSNDFAACVCLHCDLGGFGGLTVIAGEPVLGCLIFWGRGGARGGSGGQEGGWVVGRQELGTEVDEVGVVAGGEGVDGLGGAARACWQRASVLLPCATWRMRMRWARAATQVFRCDAEAAVYIM